MNFFIGLFGVRVKGVVTESAYIKCIEYNRFGIRFVTQSREI